MSAVGFALVEFRRGNRDRWERASVDLVRTLQDGAWERSVLVVGALASPGPAELDDETMRAAAAVGIRLETLGYQVFRNMVPLDVVDDLIGGIARVSWDRLAPWIRALRIQSGNEMAYEWFQWLAERLANREGAQRPAFEQHREWRPTN